MAHTPEWARTELSTPILTTAAEDRLQIGRVLAALEVVTRLTTIAQVKVKLI